MSLVKIDIGMSFNNEEQLINYLNDFSFEVTNFSKPITEIIIPLDMECYIDIYLRTMEESVGVFKSTIYYITLQKTGASTLYQASKEYFGGITNINNKNIKPSILVHINDYESGILTVNSEQLKMITSITIMPLKIEEN